MEQVLRTPFAYAHAPQSAQRPPASERTASAPWPPRPLGPRWPALSQVAYAVERTVHLLDSAVPIPGTKRSIGLDPLIGLVPVVGDIVGGAVSLGVLFLAVQYRVPTRVIGVMVFNVAVDTAVGGIPIVGDLFDFVWKANERNFALIMRHRGDAATHRPVSYWVKTGGLVLAGMASVAGSAALVGWLLRSR